MHHKKSEYRLQYNKLSEDLRRQIWQDNVALSSNHRGYTYNMTLTIEAKGSYPNNTGDEVGASTTGTNSTSLPFGRPNTKTAHQNDVKFVQKSRLLSNQATHYWEYQLRNDSCDCESGNETDSDGGPLPLHRRKHRELRDQYKQHTSGKPGTKDARDEAVQTPEWTGDEPDRGVDPACGEPMKGVGRLMLPEEKEKERRPTSPTSVASRLRTARSLSRPSRTTRKLASEPNQTQFVSFGWNEKTQKVGQKQTFNVCAPKKEVHESALLASQRRRADMEEFSVEGRGVKHNSRTPRERVCSNSSSLWMSEYQEQYSARSRQPRPVSAPPAPRPLTVWRHS